jgi:hypothetical protein
MKEEMIIENGSAGTPRPTESGAELLNELWEVMTRHVVLPEMAAEALALWVVHTYAFTLRNVTTYIGIGSPEKRCGKTTLLRLLGKLACRAVMAANISPSALFRVIEEKQPTLVIDEADTFLHGRDDMRGILNAGYDREGAYVMRVSSERKKEEWRKKGESGPPEGGTPNGSTESRPTEERKSSRLVRYSCWCPKVMAAIGRLPETLADRCIVITMQRKMGTDSCESMRELKAEVLRERCARFVEENATRIGAARPEIPKELNDRAADIWEPLLAIADLAGGEWPSLARAAAVRLSSGDEEITLLGWFLRDLRKLFAIRKREQMFSREIVDFLNPMHSRPWEDLRRGRHINEWWLSQRLRAVGIRSRFVRIDGVAGRGYGLSEIEQAAKRYVPEAKEEG